MRKKTKSLILVFLLLLVGLGISIYIIPQFSETLTRTSTIEYGKLEICDEGVCYIVRNEQVIAAPNSGTLAYYVSDAQKLKKNAKILDLTKVHVSDENASKRPCYTIKDKLQGFMETKSSFVMESPGMVSFYADGYEAYFTPDRIKNLHYEEVSALDMPLVNLVREDTLKGEPLYKISDCDHWYLITWVDVSSISTYAVDKRMTIKLPLGDIRATVSDIYEDGDMYLIVFKTNRYYEGYALERKVEATIVTSETEGILIDNESITTKEGVVGVYVINKNGDYVFTPIKVLATDGLKSAVSSGSYYDSEGNYVDTVDIYDEILRKPEAM